MSNPSALWQAARHPPADVTDPTLFRNKAVLVTGANSGLGLEAAIKYAGLGANPLILGVRTAEKGAAARAAIAAASGCSPDVMIVLTLDFSRLRTVADFAAELGKRVTAPLHVVQLAGGVAPHKYTVSPDGYEMAFQCNVLAPTLLALLLLPKVKAAADALPKSTEGATVDERTFPVISFVNSVAHNEVVDADVPRDQTLVQRINDKTRFDHIKQYFLVKLAGWYAMRGVAERVGDARAERVVVNASCPGLCKTNMLSGTPLLTRIIMAITYFIMGRTAEQGARTMISATALGPESHGRFWTNDTYPPPSKLLSSERSTELYQQTWEEILTILRKHGSSDLL